MCWIPLCWSPKCILANRSIIKLVQERIVHSSQERFIKVLAIQYLSLHLQKVAILQTKMFIQVVINSLGKRISCTTSTVRTCVNLAGIRWNCLWTTSHNRTNHGDLIGDPVIGWLICCDVEMWRHSRTWQSSRKVRGCSLVYIQVGTCLGTCNGN